MLLRFRCLGLLPPADAPLLALWPCDLAELDTEDDVIVETGGLEGGVRDGGEKALMGAVLVSAGVMRVTVPMVMSVLAFGDDFIVGS